MARDSFKTAATSTGRARTLRQQQTDAERRLWSHLRARQVGGVKFRRQQPIGRFIADFCSLDPRLVIGIDGGQHVERVAEDAQRTAFLQRCGYHVVRFWNDDVLQRTDAVLEQIAEEIAHAAEKQR